MGPIYPTWTRVFVTIGPLGFACDPADLGEQLAGHVAMAQATGNTAEPIIEERKIKAAQPKPEGLPGKRSRVLIPGTEVSVPQPVRVTMQNLIDAGGALHCSRFIGHHGKVLTMAQAQSMVSRARLWLLEYGIDLGYAVEGRYRLPEGWEAKWEALVEG